MQSSGSLIIVISTELCIFKCEKLFFFLKMTLNWTLLCFSRAHGFDSVVSCAAVAAITGEDLCHHQESRCLIFVTGHITGISQTPFKSIDAESLKFTTYFFNEF